MADNGGWILFHFSARKGNYKLFAYFADMGTDIYFILEYRFDMNIDNNDRWTALHFSANIGFSYR